jgi:rhomboid protease GluP
LTPSRPQAREWAGVLQAAGIPHWLAERDEGWAVLVPPDDVAGALDALDAHDRDDDEEEPRPIHAGTASPPFSIVGIVVALGLVGFFAITGPRVAGTAWFAQGSADAARIMAGQWWRAITALTLHADVPHLAGNALAAALLMTAVIQALGPGLGLWLLLLAGTGGNVLTALVHRTGHSAVGASTAIFAAVGILAALRIFVPRQRTGKWWVVVGAALVLLALLGTGPSADLLAHAFGLVTGAVLGTVAALVRRLPSDLVQWLLVAAAAAAVVGAWRQAL